MANKHEKAVKELWDSRPKGRIPGNFAILAATGNFGKESVVINKWCQRLDIISAFNYSRERDRIRAYKNNDLVLARKSL